MNGFQRLASLATVAVGGFGAIGCNGVAEERYKNLVDPCWPERYSTTARAETLAPFQAMAQNGVYLDQTIWNYHFEQGGEKLTAAGLEKLDYLTRRRPAPDSRVFLQTARDMGYEATAPEKYAENRRELDIKRANALQKYLAAQTASRPVAFEVQVIDAADPGFGAQYVGNALRNLPQQYQSGIVGQGGGGGGGGGQGGGGQGGGGGGQGGGGQGGGF